MLSTTLEPGTYFVVVDAVDSGVGEYTLEYTTLALADEKKTNPTSPK
jgi:hypothetical protein